MTYTSTFTNTVIRDIDGANIPADPGNADYQAYLDWLAEGNTPNPYVPPPFSIPNIITLAQARRQLRALNVFTQIDAAANADLASAVYDAWNYGNGVTRGEVLADFVQSTLGWADTQMDDFMTSASEIRL